MSKLPPWFFLWVFPCYQGLHACWKMAYIAFFSRATLLLPGPADRDDIKSWKLVLLAWTIFTGNGTFEVIIVLFPFPSRVIISKVSLLMYWKEPWYYPWTLPLPCPWYITWPWPWLRPCSCVRPWPCNFPLFY